MRECDGDSWGWGLGVEHNTIHCLMERTIEKDGGGGVGEGEENRRGMELNPQGCGDGE